MKLSLKHLTLPILVFLMMTLFFFFTARLEYTTAISENQQKAKDSLINTKSALESLLTAHIISAKGLISYVQNNPNLTQKDFEAFASGLYESSNSIIRNMGILKDTTLRLVYPVEGNEKAIGVDLSKVETQKNTVLAVKKTGKMMIVAPVDLVQGGKGIVARIPLYILDSQTHKPVYWGQMSVVFDYDVLLKDSGLLRLGETNYVDLFDSSNQTSSKTSIWSNKPQGVINGVSETIDLYQVNWTLTMSRKTGWNGLTITFWIIILSGIVTILGATYGLYMLLSSKDDLKSKVEERTHSLKTTNETLELNMGELEESQAELTEINTRLQNTVETLKETQKQLIVSEKLAALGELVAGVAHEINTPLGISVTLSSYIQRLLVNLKSRYNQHALSLQDIEEFLSGSNEAISLLNINLERASGLVNSFKQVAVDQSSEEKRQFFVKDALQDILKSIQPKFKRTDIQTLIICDPEIIIDSYPGVIAQIITNLALNSLLHGFGSRLDGQITVEFRVVGKTYELIYSDNGIGIQEEIKDKIFNPFFSTRKHAGSTGLGLHIIHNLVTQTLKGQIRMESTSGHGVQFLITFAE